MKIKEVEKILKVSRANLRFYEKEVLLTPTRGDSEYRNYSDKDIVKLKKIIMLRKCNISIDDIKCLFNKTKSLEEISLKQISKIDKCMKELKGAKTLCRKLSLETKNIDRINADKYMNIINKEEEKGNKFYNISKDFEYAEENNENDKNEKSESKMKKYIMKGIYALYVLLLFGIFCLFDIVIYDKLDMIENVTMTFIFVVLDYLFVEAFINEKHIKLNTKFYIINLIIVVLGICLYNFIKVVSNKNASLNEEVLEFSVSKTLVKISKEKYKDNNGDYVYAQGHKILDSEEKDGKIYTYIVTKYGKYTNNNEKCEIVESTSEPITIIFDKVKNGTGAYNLEEYKENEIPDKYKDKLDVDYNDKFFKDQIDNYCKKPYDI